MGSTRQAVHMCACAALVVAVFRHANWHAPRTCAQVRDVTLKPHPLDEKPLNLPTLQVARGRMTCTRPPSRLAHHAHYAHTAAIHPQHAPAAYSEHRTCPASHFTHHAHPASNFTHRAHPASHFTHRAHGA
eukprot:7382372-Prymnesium_polylepis.2